MKFFRDTEWEWEDLEDKEKKDEMWKLRLLIACLVTGILASLFAGLLSSAISDEACRNQILAIQNETETKN